MASLIITVSGNKSILHQIKDRHFQSIQPQTPDESFPSTLPNPSEASMMEGRDMKTQGNQGEVRQSTLSQESCGCDALWSSGARLLPLPPLSQSWTEAPEHRTKDLYYR